MIISAQLLSRICSHNENVKNIVGDIIVKLLNNYPQIVFF